MGRKKKPQRPETHTYDERAYKNIREIFTEAWPITKLSDYFSQIEYGQDWLVQIREDDERMSGAEIRVQSKSTNQAIGKGSISMKLKVSTLNYLDDIPLPVLLHYYHIPSNTGYLCGFPNGTPKIIKHLGSYVRKSQCVSQ